MENTGSNQSLMESSASESGSKTWGPVYTNLPRSLVFNSRMRGEMNEVEEEEKNEGKGVLLNKGGEYECHLKDRQCDFSFLPVPLPLTIQSFCQK